MAKKQQRIRSRDLESSASQWLGRTFSVVLLQGAVFEVSARALDKGLLKCRDAAGLEHNFPISDIKEIILNFPVAEHAQTSAD
ncbi:hypothetical protein [Cesiribacter sp. SM1]|uniref:hypothetical protein n=1 Tax=Cesiribacter sp. SM1 TaxID=2861196 RepID=UPI001CD455B6|nr:hypothetical protein [Cesiribacter sp. SM1]